MAQFFDNIEWTPTIGDPTLIGWLTVFAYAYAAYKSVCVFRNSLRIFVEPILRQKLLWCLIAVAMAFLSVNKQLDLQTLFTATARYFAFEQGWYSQRQGLQRLFIYCVAGTGFATMILLIWFYLSVIKTNLLAIIGLCSLIVFVLIRATSFHYVDALIGKQFLGLYVNWILELGGITLIIINATRLYSKRRPLIDLNELQKDFK